MKIFYTNIEKLISLIGINNLKKMNDNRSFMSEKRLLEHCAGRYITLDICEKIYNIPSPQIINVNNKPQLKNNEIYFSITHSSNYVMTVFDSAVCGIDMEKIRKVNLEKMSKRYNQNFKSLEDFFIFWTRYECSVKVGGKYNFISSQYLNNDYIYSVCSEVNKLDNVELYEYLPDKIQHI